MTGSDEPRSKQKAAPPRDPSDAPLIPEDLRVMLKEQRLVIDWGDGLRSDFQMGDLRRQCPCASCRAERAEHANNPLRILKYDPQGVRVTDAKLVGNYAIQLTWSDGHDTGIFDFRFLHSLQKPEAGK